MAPKKKATKVEVPRPKSSKVLDNFLGEVVIIFLRDKIQTQDFDGGIVEAPLVAEGLFLDYDEDWVLIGNEDKTVITCINKDDVFKIDSLDASQMRQLGTPDRRDFN